jgi:hypothetical protein
VVGHLYPPISKIVHGFFQFLVHNMRINPGGNQFLVAQGLLDQAQVLGGPEEVGGKAMAQDVKVNLLFKTGLPGVFATTLRLYQNLTF